MFGKLLKHEFKATSRIIPFIYLALIFFTAIACISYKLKMNGLISLSVLFMVLVGIAAIIITLVTCIMRFHKSMFGNEGYLSNTLPVKKSELLATKTITSFVWYILSFLIWFMCFFLFLSLVSNDLYSQILSILPFSVLIQFIAVIGGMLLLQSIYFIAQIYFCITLSNTKKFQQKGVAMGFVFYIAIYIINSIISGLLEMYVPLGIKLTPNGVALTFESMIDTVKAAGSSVNTTTSTFFELSNLSFGICNIGFELLATIALFWIITKLLNKKTSVR
ncbi:MAG: hypothetical protein Q8876_08545 [Bacillota bacterium]|nr:hypothetical protein [Bacillota bacterium]